MSICCVYRLYTRYVRLVISSYILLCCTSYLVSTLMLGLSHAIQNFSTKCNCNTAVSLILRRSVHGTPNSFVISPSSATTLLTFWGHRSSRRPAVVQTASEYPFIISSGSGEQTQRNLHASLRTEKDTRIDYQVFYIRSLTAQSRLWSRTHHTRILQNVTAVLCT